MRGESMTARTVRYTGIFLAAIVWANYSTGWTLVHHGLTAALWVSVFNALVFIGLDITCRDVLHEAWHHDGLVWKMGLLIAAGSLISWLLNSDVLRVAVASFAAFAAAALVDTVIYQWLLRRRKPWMVKTNGSNVPTAAVDSIVFPLIAFPVLTWWIVGVQFAAKVVGGFAWSLALRGRRA